MRALAPALAALLAAAGCKTPDAGQGGAKFLAARPELPRVGPEAMYAVCFERGAQGAVTLQFGADGQIFFEVQGGASNSTARCVREIAASWPERPSAQARQEVAAPPAPASGWVWLAWARLLSASRFGPERGLLDPAPLVAACLERGMGLRPGATFEVEPAPVHQVRVLANDGHPGAVTDTERCVEAVLGAAVWPSSRPASFRFDDRTGAPAPAGAVEAYFHQGQLGAAIDPTVIHEAMVAVQPRVGACWEAALARRPGLGGGRSVRMRFGPQGSPEAVTIAGNVSQSPRTAADYLLDGCLRRAVQEGVRLGGAAAGESAYSWVFAARGG